MAYHRTRDLHIRLGGVHFKTTKQSQAINRFVRGLPPDKRGSLYDVAHALEEAGYIEVQNDGQLVDPSGEQHP